MGKAEELRQLSRQTRSRLTALDGLRAQQRVIAALSERRLLQSRQPLTGSARRCAAAG